MITSYVELIAGAYHAASLAGAPMKLAATVLESVRTCLVPSPTEPPPTTAEANRAFAAEEVLDREIAAADDPLLIDVLIRLRDRMREVRLSHDRAAIRAGFAESVAAGWQAWRRAFGTGAGNFRFRHCRELAAELEAVRAELPAVFPPPDDVVELAAAAPDLVDEEWGGTEGVFLRVGRSELIAPPQRAKALISAAQVRIYFGKDLDAAQRYIDEARSVFDDGRIDAATGELRVKQGRREEARQAFEEAVRRSPELADGYLAMASFLLADPKAPDFASAEQWCRQGLQRVGGIRAYQLLLELSAKRSATTDPARIEELLARAVRANPDQEVSLRFVIGRAYADVAAYDRALPYFDQILAAKPPRPNDYLAWRGILRNHLGRRAEARADLLDSLRGPAPPEGAQAELEKMAVAVAGEARAVAAGKAVLDNLLGVLGDGYRASYEAKLADLTMQVSLALNDAGNSEYAAGRYPAAVELYQQAIALRPHPVYCTNLASAWELRTDVPAVEALAQARDAVRRAAELAPNNTEYRARAEKLERTRALTERWPLPVTMLPVVTPIAMEVGTGIGAIVEGVGGALSDAAAKTFAAMRDAVWAQFGVKIPGVRVRENDSDLPGNTYIFMLWEVPLVSGSVELDQLWAWAPPSRVESLGIAAQGIAHPASGDLTCWIEPRHRQTVVDAGIVVTTPLDFLVTHLRSVVEAGLADFLGQQEVENLLEEAQLLDQARAQAGTVCDFVAVLRGLVAERVPVNDVAALWEGFVSARAGGADLVDTGEALRRLPTIRERLPGNQARVPRYLLGDHLAAAVGGAIARGDAVPVLAMEPEACQAALTAVRTTLDGTRRAIVVCERAVRPFVRKLVELELPDLIVTGRDELLAAPDTALPSMELS